MLPDPKEARRNELYHSLHNKREVYYTKFCRAKNAARKEHWWAKYILLAQFLLNQKQTQARNTRRFGQPDEFIQRYRNIAWWKDYQERRKAKGQHKFLQTCHYNLWFFSGSLTADYGTFRCDRCGLTFHHSPSTITRAAKPVYTCCCGYCTNELVQNQSKPYY